MNAHPCDGYLDDVRLAVPAEIAALPATFGAMLRGYRIRCALSQNQLARSAGCDPAYVNRLERAGAESTTLPSRRMVLAIWTALIAASGRASRPITTDDRERLLVAAGLAPESILAAGGWDAFVTQLRQRVIMGFASTIDQLDESLRAAAP